MVKEAEANRAEDEKRKEKADAVNEAEQLIYMTEKSIKELGDKVSEEDKTKAEELIKDLKEALEKDDVEDIKKKTEALQEKAMEFGAKVYEEAQKANAANNTEATEETKKDDDDVIDAKFEE